MVLNGAFETPFVAYDLQAASLGFDETIVEILRARGRAKVDTRPDHHPDPAPARARITGLNPAVGGLLTNVALNGTLNISGTKIAVRRPQDPLRPAHATAVLAADLASGEYRAGLQGTVDNYQIEGIGLLDITSDIDVVSAGSGFGIKGKVAVRTRRIDNATARDLLGGNASAVGQSGDEPGRVVTLAQSPAERAADEDHLRRRHLWPDGRINLRATGVSRAYGALAVIVTGTLARPHVQLVAGQSRLRHRASRRQGDDPRDRERLCDQRHRPVGLRPVRGGRHDPLRPRPDDDRRPSPALRRNDLHRADRPDAGRAVRRHPGDDRPGPAGHGPARRGGRYQRADIDARANGAEIPGEQPILIQRGLIAATVILYPDAPHIVGDAQLAGVRAANFLLARARAKIDYRGGRGIAQLFAEGTSGVPFRVAANAALSPDLIRAAAQGQVNRIPFRLARPAEISKVGADWQLAPARLVLPAGQRPARRPLWRRARRPVADARFRPLDHQRLLARPRPRRQGDRQHRFRPAQSGRLPARRRPAPDRRLHPHRNRRPLDAGRHGPGRHPRPEGGELAAVIRRGGAVIGRAQARLQPVGGGAELDAAADRRAARGRHPLQRPGRSAVVAERNGRPAAVRPDRSRRRFLAAGSTTRSSTGVIRANNLTFVDETYGTRITNLALQGRFTSSRLEIEQLTGRAGRGTISGQGSVGFASAAGYPIDIRLTLDDAQLARSDTLGATLTGDLAITNSRGRAR